MKRKSDIKIVSALALAALAVIGLAIAALVVLTGAVSETTLRAWAVIASALVLPVFAFGFYLGKVEARGVLSGFDKSLDRMAGLVEKVVTVRDASRITVHNATRPQSGYTIDLPTPRAPITHRQLPRGADVVDL